MKIDVNHFLGNFTFCHLDLYFSVKAPTTFALKIACITRRILTSKVCWLICESSSVEVVNNDINVVSALTGSQIGKVTRVNAIISFHVWIAIAIVKQLHLEFVSIFIVLMPRYFDFEQYSCLDNGDAIESHLNKKLQRK